METTSYNKIGKYNRDKSTRSYVLDQMVSKVDQSSVPLRGHARDAGEAAEETTAAVVVLDSDHH